MYWLRAIVVIVFWTCLDVVDVASQTITRRELLRGELGRVYFSERSIYLTLQLRSPVIGVQEGQIVHYNRTAVRYAEFGQILHPKERTVTQTDHHGNRLRTLKYGKANHLYTLRAGKGRTQYFTEVGLKNFVGVAWQYRFGATLGLVKPHYVILRIHEDGADYTDLIRYSPETADIFLDRTKLVGDAPVWKGVDEIQLIPGVHASTSMHMSFKSHTKVVMFVEAGLRVDALLKPVLLMAERPPSALFANLFLTLHIGKRS